MQQGFFSVQQTCSTCRGQGKIIKNPCNSCHGSGVKDRQQTLEVTIPAGVDNGDRVRLTGKGEAVRDGQAGGLEPTDRRCYGFFHPQLVDEPLIFVEVALTREIPDRVGGILDLDRQPIPAEEATTAVFYSISNTQKGLAGVTFGNFLIKQVVEELKAELPNMKTFVTLSPVPGFAAWLERERRAEGTLDPAQRALLDLLDDPAWREDPEKVEAVRGVLLPLAARYFLEAKTDAGKPVDPVARFHLGNGARLERLNYLGDVSENGLRQAHGLMVNYLYALDEIEANHEAFAEKGVVAAAPEVKKLLPPRPAA